MPASASIAHSQALARLLTTTESVSGPSTSTVTATPSGIRVSE